MYVTAVQSRDIHINKPKMNFRPNKHEYYRNYRYYKYYREKSYYMYDVYTSYRC